jgi:hypothetical protein
MIKIDMKARVEGDDAVFKHEMKLRGEEAAYLGSILEQFGEFLKAMGFDVTVFKETHSVGFAWGDGHEEATFTQDREEDETDYNDDTHGLDAHDPFCRDERVWERLPQVPFGVGEIVHVNKEPLPEGHPFKSWDDGDKVKGMIGKIVNVTHPYQVLGSEFHLVEFNPEGELSHQWWVHRDRLMHTTV